MAEFSSACTGSSPVARFFVKIYYAMFVWIILVVIGVGIIAYNRTITESFGRRAWAERYLWGTSQWLIKIWFAIMILGVIITFGWSGVISTKVPQGFTTNTSTNVVK